ASPQESAVSRQKKLKIRHDRPSRKSFSRTTRPITASRPFLMRISSRSPMRFMAAESRTSPVLDAMTSVPIATHSLSEFMLLLGSGEAVRSAALGERRPAGYQADTAGNEQHPGPSPGADGFVQKVSREKRSNHVAESRGRQNVGEVSPGERRQVGIKE